MNEQVSSRLEPETRTTTEVKGVLAHRLEAGLAVVEQGPVARRQDDQRALLRLRLRTLDLKIIWCHFEKQRHRLKKLSFFFVSIFISFFFETDMLLTLGAFTSPFVAKEERGGGVFGDPRERISFNFSLY